MASKGHGNLEKQQQAREHGSKVVESSKVDPAIRGLLLKPVRGPLPVRPQSICRYSTTPIGETNKNIAVTCRLGERTVGTK